MLIAANTSMPLVLGQPSVGNLLGWVFAPSITPPRIEVLEIALVIKSLLFEAVPHIGQLWVATTCAHCRPALTNAQEASEEVEQPQHIHEDAAHLRSLGYVYLLVINELIDVVPLELRS